MKNIFKKTTKPLETKAVRSQSGTTTSIKSMIPTCPIISNDPVDLMSYNRGYVAACNNKISSALASSVFKLYAKMPDDGTKFLNSTSVNKDIISRISRETKAQILTGKTKLVELGEHPFIDVMNRPYEDTTISQFFSIISSYIGLIGNCYIYKILDDSGQLLGLQVLESEYITITFDSVGRITSYIYRPQGSRSHHTFDACDIVHIKNITAGSVIAGRGNLEDCIEAYSVSHEAQAYTRTLLANYCVPGTLLTLKEGHNATDESMNKLSEMFTRRFSGNSRGRAMAVGAELDIKQVSTELKDNLTDKFVEMAKKEICACYNVPLDLVDSSNSNRATITAAESLMMKYGVYPKLVNILDQLNRQVVQPYYSKDLLFWYDPAESMEPDPSEQAALYKTYIDAGILTADEARIKLGFEPRGDNNE